jgi:hypothetical protein
LVFAVDLVAVIRPGFRGQVDEGGKVVGEVREVAEAGIAGRVGTGEGEYSFPLVAGKGG